MLALVAIISPITVRMYTPSFLSMKHTLSTDNLMIQYSLIIYLILLGLSQLIYCWLQTLTSCVKVNLRLGLTFYLIGSLTCFVSKLLALFYIGRLFQAFGIAIIAINYRAIITIFFEKKYRLKVYSVTGMLMTLIAMPDSYLSGWLTDNISWRYSFLLMCLIATLCLITTHNLRQIDKKYQDKKISVFNEFIRFLTNKRLRQHLFPAITQYAGFITFIINAPFIIINNNIPPNCYGFYLMLIAFAYFVGSLIVYILGRICHCSRDSSMMIGLIISFISTISLIIFSIQHILNSRLLMLMIIPYQIGTCIINQTSNSLLFDYSNINPIIISSFIGASKNIIVSFVALASLYFCESQFNLVFFLFVITGVNMSAYIIYKLKTL